MQRTLNNKVKKKQRHTRTEKPNMYLNILIRITNICIRNTKLHQGNTQDTLNMY